MNKKDAQKLIDGFEAIEQIEAIELLIKNTKRNPAIRVLPYEMTRIIPKCGLELSKMLTTVVIESLISHKEYLKEALENLNIVENLPEESTEPEDSPEADSCEESDSADNENNESGKNDENQNNEE